MFFAPNGKGLFHGEKIGDYSAVGWVAKEAGRDARDKEAAAQAKDKATATPDSKKRKADEALGASLAKPAHVSPAKQEVDDDTKDEEPEEEEDEEDVPSAPTTRKRLRMSSAAVAAHHRQEDDALMEHNRLQSEYSMMSMAHSSAEKSKHYKLFQKYFALADIRLELYDALVAQTSDNLNEIKFRWQRKVNDDTHRHTLFPETTAAHAHTHHNNLPQCALTITSPLNLHFIPLASQLPALLLLPNAPTIAHCIPLLSHSLSPSQPQGAPGRG